jgi:hypothetical protein
VERKENTWDNRGEEGLETLYGCRLQRMRVTVTRPHDVTLAKWVYTSTSVNVRYLLCYLVGWSERSKLAKEARIFLHATEEKCVQSFDQKQ